MAVVPGYVGSAAITWAASATASVVGQGIGTASWDRLVVVAVSIEETVTIDSCTIAGIAATLGISVRNTTGTPDNAVAFFYAYVPTGTTATIAVTLSGVSSLTGRISVWATTGAAVPHSDSNSAQGAGANQALGGVTIPTNGAGYWVFNNATTGTAVTWTNATERDDTSVGTYRHSVADAVAAGTPTVTADGATTNQILAGIAFSEAPPAMGWDRDPVNSITKAVKSVSPVSIALAASGAILAPYPYFQAAIPDFAHASTTTDQVNVRSLYYQAKIAPPPQVPVVVAPTTMDWQPQTNRAAPTPKPQHSTPTYTFKAPVQDYTVFAVQTSYVATKALHYQDKFEVLRAPAPAAQGVAITWQQAPDLLFQRRGYGLSYLTAPLTAPAPNTVTIDKWQQPLGRAVPPTKLGLSDIPYSSLAIIIDNTITIDKWQFNWSGPPRYWPPQIPASPFIPEEATANNTVDISNWQQPLSEAVPHGWPPYAPITVPYFPYLAGENTGTAATWFSWWGGPPRFWPPKPMALPFWPKQATSENTVTSDKWLVDLSRAARRTRSLPAQYQFPFTARTQFTVAWQQPLSTPIVKPRRVSQQTVASYPTPAFFPNTVTIDKWGQPLSKAAIRNRVHYTAPIVYPTQVIPAQAQRAFVQVTTSFVLRRVLHYQDIATTLSPLPVQPSTLFINIVMQARLSTVLHYQDITKIISPPPPFVPPVTPVVKGWFAEGEAGQIWALESPAVCGVGTVGSFQEDTFQEDAFDVGANEGECWTVEIPPANEWEEEEPDP